jgi:hypothetical protein
MRPACACFFQIRRCRSLVLGSLAHKNYAHGWSLLPQQLCAKRDRIQSLQLAKVAGVNNIESALQIKGVVRAGRPFVLLR